MVGPETTRGTLSLSVKDSRVSEDICTRTKLLRHSLGFWSLKWLARVHAECTPGIATRTEPHAQHLALAWNVSASNTSLAWPARGRYRPGLKSPPLTVAGGAPRNLHRFGRLTRAPPLGRAVHSSRNTNPKQRPPTTQWGKVPSYAPGSVLQEPGGKLRHACK